MSLIRVGLLCFAALLGVSACAMMHPDGEVVPVDAPSPRVIGKAKVGEAYFDFKGPLLRGGEFRLGDEVGRRVVLMQFWGVRCEPCLQEFKLLDRLYQTYADLGLLVVGVNTDGLEAQTLAQVMAERRISPSYPIVLDQEFHAATHYTNWLVPVSVVIDRGGTVRAVHTGYNLEIDDAIEAEVARVLEE